MDVKQSKHIALNDLEEYRQARQLSRLGWATYEALDWQTKKLMGDQFIRATDSVGANIAEGYGRFHYLDRIKFYYNARGSLKEACNHWAALLHEREKMDSDAYRAYCAAAASTSRLLQSYIQALYRTKDGV